MFIYSNKTHLTNRLKQTAPTNDQSRTYPIQTRTGVDTPWGFMRNGKIARVTPSSSEKTKSGVNPNEIKENGEKWGKNSKKGVNPIG